jgi:hypothetical protein
MKLIVFAQGAENLFLLNILVRKKSLTSILILMKIFSYTSLMLMRMTFFTSLVLMDNTLFRTPKGEGK